jgi:hypothetical protein
MKFSKLDFLRWSSVLTYSLGIVFFGIVIGTYVGTYEASGTIKSVDFNVQISYLTIGLILFIIGTIVFFKIKTKKIRLSKNQ